MTQIQKLRASLTRARETMRDFAENYDHDEDAHRYRTSCRVCDAEEAKSEIDAVLTEPVEEDTGLIALLTDAMHELDVLGSYVDDPDIVWPTLGLKVTAKAHKALALKIKDALSKRKEEAK